MSVSDVVAGQAGGAVMGSATILASLAILLKTIGPQLIKIWFDRKDQAIEKERANHLLARENEELRKKNADLQIGQLENIGKVHTAQIGQLMIQQQRVLTKLDEHEMALRHTDGLLARIIPYFPVLDRIGAWLDKLDKKGNLPAKEPAPDSTKVTLERADKFPEQEHIIKGETTIIRNKKPGEGQGSP